MDRFCKCRGRRQLAPERHLDLQTPAWESDSGDACAVRRIAEEKLARFFDEGFVIEIATSGEAHAEDMFAGNQRCSGLRPRDCLSHLGARADAGPELSEPFR